MSIQKQPPKMTLEQAVANANAVCEAISASLVDREVEVTLGVVALISKQNLLLLGKPGTAKTLSAYLLGQSLQGDYFEKLLSRFTVPPEIFGPLSVKKYMEQELYETNIEGFLPSVRLATIDEVYKASSAILNSLLTIINERVYHNGRKRIKVPLETLIGCSNELPEDSTLEALHDRFLLRHEVHRVSEVNRGRLLALGEMKPVPAFSGLPVLQEAQRAVIVPAEVSQKLLVLVKACLATGIEISDRRIRQSVEAVKGHATLFGRTTADSSDLVILQYVFWQTPDQIPAVAQLTQQVIQGVSVSVPRQPTPQRSTLPVPAPQPVTTTLPVPSPMNMGMNQQGPAPQASSGRAAITQQLAGLPTAGLIFQANRVVMTSGVHDTATNEWLHMAIDAVLTRADALPAQREMVVDWKNSISKQLGPIGMPWLGGA